MNVWPRRDLRPALKVDPAALLQSRFYLFQIRAHASRRDIEAAGEFAALFHLVDSVVRERHDELEFMPSDRAWEAGQYGGRTGICDWIFAIIILIGHHQDAYAAWLLGHVYPPVGWRISDAPTTLPGCVSVVLKTALTVLLPAIASRVSDVDVHPGSR